MQPWNPEPVATTEPLIWKLYNLHRDYLKHEDSLINWRLSWMVALQGLCFAGVGLISMKWLDFQVGQKHWLVGVQLAGAMLITMGMGFSIAWVTRRTVGAAKAAQDNLEVRAQHLIGLQFDDRFDHPTRRAQYFKDAFAAAKTPDNPILLPMITGGGLQLAVTHGSTTQYLPIVFMVVWFVLFVGWVATTSLGAILSAWGS